MAKRIKKTEPVEPVDEVVEVTTVPEPTPPPARGGDDQPPDHWPGWRRFLVGLFPTAEGGEPPVLHSARARFSWMGWSFVGASVGGIAAASVLLAHYAVPGIPWVLWGLLTGLLLGIGVAFIVTVKSAVAKGGGAFFLLTIPALVFLLPLGLVFAAFRGSKARFSAGKAKP